jgi:alkylation response protein AidB-like acyl-CoA dehydrogenase
VREDEPDGGWSAWWPGHAGDLEEPRVAAAVFAAAVADGVPDLPLPGGGRTAERLAALRAWGEADLVFARLAEGHADALAILAELGGPRPVGARWGVWAAVPRSLTATREGGGWRINGERPWCSGARSCTHALVTAAAPDGVRLFAVTLDRATATPLDGTWPAVGMAGSESLTVRFHDVPGEPVGGPDDYVRRPGFWHGGIGVAACWYGGAVGVARTLWSAAAKDHAARNSAAKDHAGKDPAAKGLGPHALAHLGAVDATLVASGALLDLAAEAIDADPKGDAQLLAARVRASVAATVTEVLDRVGRALGAGPLCRDRAHARRVADLTVYVRQSHAETDLESLGEMVRKVDGAPW